MGMGKWFRLYTKIHTHHYAVIGIAGIVTTVIYASPGEHLYDLCSGTLRYEQQIMNSNTIPLPACSVLNGNYVCILSELCTYQENIKDPTLRLVLYG